ncbi:unnamed protein product [Rotaria sp. Silwood2]|nr:unnamed protein product [Rotaria sp. Silwood2]CAF2978264.1 unnamed protein product [Rotaria sp. Silwood2]CAF3999892.1 unnamed protein product [Rotaria sp. Silwood2]CAF4120285.1 unnamed protein product [Rotaria sp. Silwood2]CAF4148244.1 unnamed protein product [Rotaria sp. Silwood2]
MSVSKLESLPNEILSHIFEKYMNGVDILVAFVNSQNRRFDALISQCRRFYFNFFNCRKDYFDFCLDLLPTYIERIEILILSEQNTPGQIHTFLSFFPLFISFKRLRKLYLELNSNTIDWVIAQRAIISLSHTPIDTVILKAMETANMPTLNYIIGDIFKFKKIKRIILMNDFHGNQWNFSSNISSTVEYLTNFDNSCEFQHLQSIFQYTPHLKYLNVRLTSNSYYGFYYLSHPSNNNIISMSNLHTVILSFQSNDSTTFDILAQYLKAMPVLRRLEIKAHSALLEANAWESLLQVSLSLLTNFILKTTTYCVNEADIEKILAKFDTPFWKAKKNFYMMITKHKYSNSNRFGIGNMQHGEQDEYNQSVIQCWVAPTRARIDDIPTNEIMSFGISGVTSCLSNDYYFKNLKHLIIYNLDKDLLQWFVKYVNYLQIQYLDISLLSIKSDTISLLLSCIRNLTSLRIKYSLLLSHQNVYLGKDNYLKYLDISVDEHNFDKKDIIIISQLFPYIEHLAINMIKLSNIPLIKTYLPYLRCLTFKIIDSPFSSYNDNEQKLWNDQLRRKFKFLFERQADSITIWIDQDAFEESYWAQFSSNWQKNK